MELQRKRDSWHQQLKQKGEKPPQKNRCCKGDTDLQGLVSRSRFRRLRFEADNFGKIKQKLNPMFLSSH